MSTCIGITNAGNQCTAPTWKGSKDYCFFHDPSPEAEALRAAGRAKGQNKELKLEAEAIVSIPDAIHDVAIAIAESKRNGVSPRDLADLYRVYINLKELEMKNAPIEEIAGLDIIISGEEWTVPYVIVEEFIPKPIIEGLLGSHGNEYPVKSVIDEDPTSFSHQGEVTSTYEMTEEDLRAEAFEDLSETPVQTVGDTVKTEVGQEEQSDPWDRMTVEEFISTYGSSHEDDEDFMGYGMFEILMKKVNHENS